MGRWVKNIRVNNVDKPWLGENGWYIFIAPEVSGGNSMVNHLDPTDDKRIKTRDHDSSLQFMFSNECHNFLHCMQIQQFYGLNLDIKDAIWGKCRYEFGQRRDRSDAQVGKFDTGIYPSEL